MPTNSQLCLGICSKAREIIERREDVLDAKEEIHMIDINGEEIVEAEINPNNLLEHEAKFNEEQQKKADELKNNHTSYYVIHNHPTNCPPTLDDFIHLKTHGYTFGVIICHNGDIYKYYRTSNTNYDESDWKKWLIDIKKEAKITNNFEQAWINIFAKQGLHIKRISAKKGKVI